jgi:glycosyltransferase involved in cell wall biosynthesis
VIAFISGEYPPDVGGVGDYTCHLRHALERVGHHTSIVSRGHVGGRWNARALAWLLRHAPKTGVVHIQYQAAAYDLLGDICLLPALLRRLRPRLRCVTTFHDVRVPYLFPRAGPLREAAIRLLARTSHAVLAADRRDLAALSRAARQTFHVPIGPNVACAPPEGFERVAFRRGLGLEPGDLALVYFGMLNASKGLDLLLDSFEQVLRSQPRARLLVLGGPAGASDPTDLRTASRVSGSLQRFRSRTLQTGWLPQPELSAHLLAGDVALLPYLDGASARRGSLLACAEHGLPIISTQPAGSEVAPYVRAVDPDAAALADAVLRAARDPAPLSTLSRTLASEMSWSRITALHVAMYDRLLYSRP